MLDHIFGGKICIASELLIEYSFFLLTLALTTAYIAIKGIQDIVEHARILKKVLVEEEKRKDVFRIKSVFELNVGL